MTRQGHRIAGLILASALGSWLSGCDESAAHQRILRREENFSHTVEMLERIEATRPRSLAITLNHLEKQHERDLLRSQENPCKLILMIQAEFDRWEARQPVYDETIQLELAGDLENINRTAPIMAW